MEVADHTASAKDHCATLDQQFDPAFLKDGVDPLTDDEIFKSKGAHVNPGKVPAGFWLVKATEIFLMSNGSPRQIQKGNTNTSVIVYANGFNPELDDD